MWLMAEVIVNGAGLFFWIVGYIILLYVVYYFIVGIYYFIVMFILFYCVDS